ncbi:hypothetical protein Dimus_014856 [Dionaea muscipula]
MAVYVKSIDPKHLVGIQTTNPNPHASQLGTDFIRNHKVLGVDFASTHIYADAWDKVYSTTYRILHDSAKHGGAGTGAGTLLWQLFPDGRENMDG